MDLADYTYMYASTHTPACIYIRNIRKRIHLVTNMFSVGVPCTSKNTKYLDKTKSEQSERLYEIVAIEMHARQFTSNDDVLLETWGEMHEMTVLTCTWHKGRQQLSAHSWRETGRKWWHNCPSADTWRTPATTRTGTPRVDSKSGGGGKFNELQYRIRTAANCSLNQKKKNFYSILL